MVVGASAYVTILRLEASIVGTSLLIPFPVVAVHYKRIGEKRIVLVVGDKATNGVYDRVSLTVFGFMYLLAPFINELIVRFFCLYIGEVTQHSIGQSVEYFAFAALLIQILEPLSF